MAYKDREPFVRGDSIDLYPVEREDLETLRDLRNMPEVRLPYGYPYTPISLDEIEQEYERQLGETRHSFLIVHADDGKPIGQVMLVFEAEGFDTSGTAELRMFIHPDYHSDNVGTEAGYRTLKHGFEQMNLHRVWARVFETNCKSRSLCEKLGMEREGVLRDQLYINGEYVNMVYLGVLEQEWDEQVTELEACLAVE